MIRNSTTFYCKFILCLILVRVVDLRFRRTSNNFFICFMTLFDVNIVRLNSSAILGPSYRWRYSSNVPKLNDSYNSRTGGKWTEPSRWSSSWSSPRWGSSWGSGRWGSSLFSGSSWGRSSWGNRWG